MQGFKSKKYLGQNFLKDNSIIAKIIRHALLRPDDIVVEVGPGFGILTKELAKHVKKVIAIEIDFDLIPILKNNLKGINNVELIKGDALKFTPPDGPYKLVANIPYSITSPLLDHFIKDQFVNSSFRQPKMCTLMLQKEVAQKLCEIPPRMNVLALHTQPFGETKMLFKVSKHVFSPVPRVDSAVIRITLFEKPKITDIKTYLEFIHAGFSQKRKQLWNSLAKVLPEAEKRKMVFETAKIDPKRRAETLSIHEWGKLTKAFDNPQQDKLF